FAAVWAPFARSSPRAGSASEALGSGVGGGVCRRARTVGGVGELPEEAGDHEGHLLADIHGVVADALERSCDEGHVHRPLARVRIVADFDRKPEDVAVEAVDLAI